MAFFNEIGKKISQTTQSAVKGTKNLADIARLHSQIAEEQKLLSTLFAQMGKKYYELYPDAADEPFAPICASIAGSLHKIATLRDEIQRVKGVQKCPGCGAEIPMTATFCGICGHDMRKEPEAAQVAFEEHPECGKEDPDNGAFSPDVEEELER
ncbi:MAG: zinc ribbon domain-containing protein [Firmicutes bacterium]|nr:zinc ribbon domain-containing protein [Bacillota bacterium]